jgi:lipoprotein-releasing system permease protein
MNLPLFIARRYFFSKRKRSFISWLSVFSMLGVGVGTMALVVVLSVFNGMEELNRQLFRSFEADITIAPQQGKRLAAPADLLAKLRQLPGVDVLTPVIKDNALARYADAQTVVQIKGVDNSYRQRQQLDSAIVEGTFKIQENGVNYAVVAEGIRNDLGIIPEDPLTPLELVYPNTSATPNALNADALNRVALTVAGVFFIEARYDDFVLAPLSVVRELIGYGPNDVTGIEIQTKPNTDPLALQKNLQGVVGDTWLVQTRDEQNKDLFRAIQFEKLFTALTLSLIILVSSINIFFSLSMLVLEKQADIKILFALGATRGLVRAIFLAEGAIIALTGAAFGLGLGVLICGLQQQYGLVKMGTVTSIVDAYPVRLETNDLLLTSFVAVAVTIIMSWIPAQRAARQ